jgi:hypothetical protein
MRMIHGDEETIDLIWEEEFAPAALSAPLPDEALDEQDGRTVARIALKKMNVLVT